MAGQLNDLQHAAAIAAAGEANEEVTIFTSTARTASSNSADQTNTASRGVHVVIDMTTVPGTDTVTFTLQGKDTLSGKYYDLLESLAIVATGTTVLKIYPGITASANASASDVLPKTYRVKTTHSAGSSFTYSVTVQVVV